jgi:hypothetical protein
MELGVYSFGDTAVDPEGLIDSSLERCLTEVLPVIKAETGAARSPAKVFRIAF